MFSLKNIIKKIVKIDINIRKINSNKLPEMIKIIKEEKEKIEDDLKKIPKDYEKIENKIIRKSNKKMMEKLKNIDHELFEIVEDYIDDVEFLKNKKLYRIYATKYFKIEDLISELDKYNIYVIAKNNGYGYIDNLILTDIKKIHKYMKYPYEILTNIEKLKKYMDMEKYIKILDNKKDEIKAEIQKSNNDDIKELLKDDYSKLNKYYYYMINKFEQYKLNNNVIDDEIKIECYCCMSNDKSKYIIKEIITDKFYDENIDETKKLNEIKKEYEERLKNEWGVFYDFS